MTESSRASWNSAAGFAAGLVASTLLAVVWNTLGFASAPSDVGYELTHYFTPISWPFVFAYAIISMLLGFVTKTTWPVALGMIFTLPIACSVEVSQDSTSHNLIPFEVLFTWLPGFVIAFGAASCGRWFRRRWLLQAT
jgi:hypothetical protein